MIYGFVTCVLVMFGFDPFKPMGDSVVVEQKILVFYIHLWKMNPIWVLFDFWMTNLFGVLDFLPKHFERIKNWCQE